MKSKAHLIDRVLHWVAALLLLFMLLNLSTMLHTVDWDIQGQLEHRQSAVEMHALVGIILAIFTVARIAFPFTSKAEIPRIQPRSNKHKIFVKVTHIALYLCIGLLVITGLLMIMNYEIPITLLGVTYEGSKDNFYNIFPKIHEIHIFLQNAIWWLIAIHFIGIMYAKK
jgi:cytochrome b561